jgi:hypothetical protein
MGSPDADDAVWARLMNTALAIRWSRVPNALVLRRTPRVGGANVAL